jgi:hypothetical protein
MNIKTDIITTNLSRSIVSQLDVTYPEVFTRDHKPICRVVYSQEEWVIFELPGLNPVKMTLSNYLNCGLDRTFGPYGNIPKIVLTK